MIPPMMLSAGEPFAGYTIVRPLGAGGMGEVYLAQHPRLPRREALKILRTDISADDSFRQRFIREADSVAALEHPNIVTVHDRGECDGRLWIATQFVEGSDAAQLVRDRYPAGMPVDEVAAITAAIADALDYAHGRGLLHRDVKPANILISELDRDGNRRIYLADFGIARPLDDPAGLTATNFTFGTVAYSAPEQLMGKDIDGRADQYALAATTYHLLTGRPVYPDTNPVAVISRHLAEPPPEVSRLRPELASLNGVLAKALSKNPADRYPRCSDFARDLHARIADLTLASPSAPTAQAPTPPPPAAAPKPAPTAAPPSAKQRGGGSRAAVVISLITLGIASAVGITVWRDHNRTTTVATATPTNGPSTTAASASPPAQSSTAATTPTSSSGPGLPVSGGAAYVITPTGKTACRIAGSRVDCYVEFNADAEKEVIDGKPMTGVSFSPDGTMQWLTADRADHDYTTVDYGSDYQALNWTIKSSSQGTIFTNDTTGMGMMISAQGFTTIQPGSPTDQGDAPTSGRPCTDKDKIVPNGNAELVCSIVSTGPFVLQWQPFTQTALETVTRGANCAPADVSGDFRFARSTDDYLVWCVGYPGNPKWSRYQP